MLGSAPEEVLGSPKPIKALGPFPRHIWTHQTTPQDSLDRACYEIWKRVQRFHVGLKPKNENVPLEAGKTQTETNNTKERAVHGNSKKDEIACLVEEEYISLIMDNLSDSFSELCISLPNDTQALNAKAQAKSIENFIKSLLTKKDDSENNLILKTRKSSSQDSFGLRMKHPSTKQENDSIRSSKIEIRKLLAQFPTKSAKTIDATKGKIEMEGATSCKKDTTFCSQTDTSDTQTHDNKNQPSIFARICAKTEMELFIHPSGSEMVGSSEEIGNRSLSKNNNVKYKLVDNPVEKQMTKFTCQVPETNTDDKVDSRNLQKGSVVLTPAITPVNGTVAGKSNPKQTGPMFMSPMSTVAANTMNQSYMLNFPSLSAAVMPNGMNFGQYQTVCQQPPRMTFAQVLHPQLGCLSRQVRPFNQQHAPPVFCAPYPPVVGYIPYMQPDYSCQQRNAPNFYPSTRDHTPMAGDGPQYFFTNLYGFNPPIASNMVNSPYYTSSGKCMKPF